MRAWRILWRGLRQMFHQATGAVFLCFAAFGAAAALEEWSNPAARWLAWLGIGYAAMMVIFGLSAFRDARRARQPGEE